MTLDATQLNLPECMTSDLVRTGDDALTNLA